MIRVLVVDDDRMARKGLILTAPWATFGMEVVGEASNGQAALEFLTQAPVDLVLTDLAMPLMSGIDLMRAAALKHPGLKFVVLSFHQDFPQVQEALRLGALDYVAKQDLEREQLEKVLGRICDRFLQTLAGPAPASNDPPSRLPVNVATAYFRMGEAPFPSANSCENLDSDLWLDLRPANPSGYPGWSAVPVTGLLNEPLVQVHRVLSRYRQNDWFYDRDEPFLKPRSIMDLAASAGPSSGDSLEELRSRFLDVGWIAEEPLARGLLADLHRARLEPRHLFSLLAVVQELWIRIYGHNGADSLPAVETLGSWAEANRWLEGFRANIREDLASPRFAPHIQMAILRAVRIVHRDFDRPLVLEDMAHQVNMSRSHFAECFRGVTGKTFLEYQRSVRMEKARELLVTGDEAVYRVGELVGYQDEKYFSRQFRDCFGLPPTEYRRVNKRG